MKRHCNIKQSLRTKLVGFTLFAAFACVRAFADSDIDLLRKICEEQKKHAGRLENHSYTVNCEGQQELESVHLPIRTVQQITLLNGNARMSRSYYVSGGSSMFVINEYCKEELLLNGEMLLVWPDRESDFLKLFYRTDFEKPLFDNQLAGYFPYDPIELGYGTDFSQTLSEVLDKYLANPVDSQWTWKILREFDLEKQATLFVLSRATPGEDRPDIIIKVDPTKEYVVTEFVNRPYRQPDNYCIKVTKDFERVADQWMVSRYQYLQTSDYSRKPIMDLCITFSNISPTPPEAIGEMSIAALKLPKSKGVSVAAPDERGIPVMREDRLELLDGHFVPARGTFSSAPRINPLPNAPKTKTDELIDWVIENLIYLIP